MCEPATTAMILTAVGSGAQATNQHISGRRQDRAAAAGIRRQSEIQREGDASVNQLIQDLQKSTPAGEKAASLEGFVNTLQRNARTTGGDSDSLLVGDERFADRIASGEAETQRRGRETAGQLARIEAPVRQRQREGRQTGDVASGLSELGRRSDADEFITRLRMASKRPNELVNALADVAKGAGSVISLGSGGADLMKMFNSSTLIDAPISGAGSTPFNIPTRLNA